MANSDLRPLFPELERRLITLLRSLSAEEWQRPTICAGWTVKDIAAHLLDTSLRRLSMARDRYFGETPQNVDSYAGLVDFLDRLNADWVTAMRRVSPAVLIESLESSAKQVQEHLHSLDLAAPATFPVAWAGEEQSTNAFDIAREYTERWHHQQQIRLATGRERDADCIMGRELYFPAMDTFMKALPHHYREAKAPTSAVVKIIVSGEAGGEWWIARTAEKWEFSVHTSRPPAAIVTVPEEIAWRVLTKGMPRAEAALKSTIEGDKRLGEHFFRMVSVMA